MLEVTFYRDDRNRRRAVRACGHADFAEHGQDIVCAAVSAILQAMRLGLEGYAKIELQSLQRSGELHLEWTSGQSERESVQAIVATAELAVEQIALRYPEHVCVRREQITGVLGGEASRRVTNSQD